MKTFVVCSALWLVGSVVGARAQPAAGPLAAAPKKVAVYLAADGTQLPSADGAHHRADITLRDSVSGTMREYFPSGKLWRYVPYAHVGRGIRHGFELTYDEAGTLRQKQAFAGGQRQGERQNFDSQGRLARTVVYAQDRAVGRTCFTPAGAATACREEKMLPEYPGGITGVVQDLERAAVVPNDELERGIYGAVLLRFVVDAEAQVVGAVVAEAPTPGLGQAALQALRKIKPFVAPGQLNGEPVAVLYSVPVYVGGPVNRALIHNRVSGTPHAPTATFLEEDTFVGKAGDLVPKIGELGEPSAPYTPNPSIGGGSVPYYPGRASSPVPREGVRP